ncbi:nodulin MtN21 /EamA-like transporter family protein [Striga asiatica]|uniref:WAT1-related protein n=1 Tax=Striga asiatica TaxID=4170 RepID=A0A5A7QKH4_STRAF|nr:nodulin MtN21 /EamA-like transporter family protein [Striga asiatica]
MEGDLMPFLTMVVVQLGYAGMNIISKLAMDSGMNPFVQVAYRQIFATVAIAPFAYFVERITVNQITYFVGLKNSTPTTACALSNINPAVTFIMALPFGLEKLGLKSKAGQAKVLGTLVCVGGAILVSFYHGQIVNIGQSGIHWKYAETTSSASPTAHLNFILGPFLLLVSAISWAAWLIVQTRISQKYGSPYSSSAIMCLMASVQCVIVAICFDHSISAWSLRSSIRIVSSIYSGIVCSALAFGLMSWCIERKGPLYVSVFSPLLLVIVAILSWALLDEKLYAGTLVGSSLIVLGLYGVLWGKKKEMINLKGDNDNIQELGGDHKKGNQNVDADYDLESLSSANIHEHKTGH